MAHILVIDDEEGIRTSVRRLFELDGHTVVTADDGLEGERYLHEHPVDLVVSDIVMPNKDGIEFLADLLAHHPRMKVIIMSGGARMAKGADLDFLLSVAGSHGAARVMKKPFDNDTLLVAVRELLDE